MDWLFLWLCFAARIIYDLNKVSGCGTWPGKLAFSKRPSSSSCYGSERSGFCVIYLYSTENRVNGSRWLIYSKNYNFQHLEMSNIFRQHCYHTYGIDVWIYHFSRDESHQFLYSPPHHCKYIYNTFWYMLINEIILEIPHF